MKRGGVFFFGGGGETTSSDRVLPVFSDVSFGVLSGGEVITVALLAELLTPSGAVSFRRCCGSIVEVRGGDVPSAPPIIPAA